MAASPVVTCAGLLTSAGTERVRLGSHGAVMWFSICVCVHVCVCAWWGLCWHLSGSVRVSGRSGCALVGLKCVRGGESQPSTPCFLDSERARKQAGQHELNLPFISLYTCISQSLPCCARLILPSIPSLHFQRRSSWHFLFIGKSAVERGGKRAGEQEQWSSAAKVMSWNCKYHNATPFLHPQFHPSY